MKAITTVSFAALLLVYLTGCAGPRPLTGWPRPRPAVRVDGLDLDALAASFQRAHPAVQLRPIACELIPEPGGPSR